MLKSLIRILFLVLGQASLSVVAGASEPELNAICKTWTGLDKSSKPKFLYQIQITLEPAAEKAAEPEPRDASESARLRAEAQGYRIDTLDPLLALEASNVTTKPVTGPLRSTPIGRSMDGTTDTKEDTIEGVYYPDLGLLKFKRVGPGWFPVGDVHAVFNPSATEMCLVFSGSLAKNPPLYLSAGSELNPDLRAIGKVEGASAAPATTQNRFSQTRDSESNGPQTSPVTRANQTNQLADSRAVTQQIRQRYQQDRQAIQQQISAATRARDTDLVKSLREKQKQLTADFNRQMTEARTQATGGVQNPRQPRAPSPTTPVRRTPSASDCPEHILAWVGEMERNGGSLQTFNGYLELANLFRPTAFAPHFGKTFAELNEQELKELGTLMQLSCANDGSALAKGGLRIPLAQLLNRPTTWGSTEMGIAGLAQEVAGAWAQRMNAFLDAEPDFPTVQALENETLILSRTLWPTERDRLNEAAPLAKSNAIERLIVSTIDGYAAQMEQADPQGLFLPLYNIAEIRYQRLFEKVLPSELDRVQKRYIEESLHAIEAMKERFKRELAAMPDPKVRNAYTLDWWGWGYNSALKFFGDHMETDTFHTWMGQQREKDWQTLKPTLFQEIDAITSLIYAKTFMPSISLYAIDETRCPTWQEIREYHSARLKALEREALIARVGEGPFGVDYPGAIYLNAIYRLDREQIARENRLLSEPMNDYFNRNRDNILQQIVENQMREYFKGSLTGTNFVDPLLAYFAGAYQFHYPNCMVNPRQITDVTYFKVITNGIVTDSGVSSETAYVINGRHAAAFKAMGERPFSPENRDFIMNLFGPLVPQDIRDNAALLKEAVTGMRRAMQERPCDDPVIQQLDENLMILFYEN